MDSGHLVQANRSKMMEDENFFKSNLSNKSNHVIQIQDEISNHSFSPNSANSAALTRKLKNKEEKKSPFDVGMKPTVLGTFNEAAVRNVRDKVQVNKMEKVRSTKQINVARLNTRKKSENLEV
mmetsp:Transcript_2091/g.2656  ORF Transcript_2091/g.2656 Transcript_2091/m.2656 type:complete len:123 (+) Transcript_2091:702-1070(+)